MTLVFGGAYQGKLAFALEKLASEIQEEIKESDILDIPKLCGMAVDKNDQDLNYGVDAIITEHSRGAKCIYGLDAYIRLMIERGLDSDKWIADFINDIGKEAATLTKSELVDNKSAKNESIDNRLAKNESMENKRSVILPIVIMNDVSQGLVPMDADDRSFREANGRALIRLAESATNVYRVFCGIPSRIK